MNKAYGRTPVLWLLPIVIMLGVFHLFPLLEVVRLSLTNKSMITLDYKYTLKSFLVIFTDYNFIYSVKITLIFAVSTVALQLTAGFLIALVINTGIEKGLRGTILTRTVVLSAWMVPGVLTGIVWKFLLSSSNYGIINYILEFLGLKRIPFLTEPAFALASVILANLWRGTAFSMIVQFAGLQRIPSELYEASKVDGAGPFQRLRYITIPQMRPIIFINVVLITVYSVNTFDMIMSLTKGGPARTTEVLTLSAYNFVFRYLSISRGAAVAVILLLFNLCMSVIYTRTILGKSSDI
jgi:multiple sugar transport system permease protein